MLTMTSQLSYMNGEKSIAMHTTSIALYSSVLLMKLFNSSRKLKLLLRVSS